jgi:arylsulfatase A-like enzyme
VWASSLGLLTTLAIGLIAPTGVAASDDPPNVIVIVTDDQSAATMSPRVMPTIDRLLVRAGVSFDNAVVPTPLCCPSRAALLSGQYGHNNGVLWNAPGYRDLERKVNTLPVWMKRAGYRTAHVGKYLNGYLFTIDDPAQAAPGWEEWHTVLHPTSYYSAPFANNGRFGESGTEPGDYTTSIINRTAVRMIDRYAGGSHPLFMVVDQFAPHRSGGPSLVPRCAAPGPEPALADRDAFADEPLPHPPSFNEADVADKPSFIRRRDPFDADGIEALERTYGCTLAALGAVDRGAGQIWRALGRAGERRNTAIIFTSDNGLYFGEHRLSLEKIVPYRESLDVPLAMRLPSSTNPAPESGRVVSDLVANVDLTATILDLAGAEPCRKSNDCRTLDGRSLLGLAAGRDRGWPANRRIPLELDTGGKPPDANSSCTYVGFRSVDEIYLRHTSAAGPDRVCEPTDQVEHYDLLDDPAQLTNLFPGAVSGIDPILELALQRRADALTECAGIRGRDEPAGSRPFCR